MILNLEKLRRDYKLIRKEDPGTGTRLDVLIEMTKIDLKSESACFMAVKRLAISALCTSLKISQRTLDRWKSEYHNRGVQGLVEKKAPGRKAEELSKHIKQVIEEYRRMYRWGSEVLQAHLRYDHNFQVGRFKIDRYLKNSGLLEKYPVTTRKKKVKIKNKHIKKVTVEHPGIHTQMDVKYQLHILENRQKSYVYNFIDHASNWSFKRAYSAINAKHTADFMKRLEKICPFRILRLQTDNGQEFTYKYTSVLLDKPAEHPLDNFCESRGIAHKLIPPGEKELQGLVERGHRQDDQELFLRINPFHLEEFNNYLDEYRVWRNESRRFKKLNWKTPNQWLRDYAAEKPMMAQMNPQEKAEGPFPRVSSELSRLELKKKLNEDERQDEQGKGPSSEVTIRKLAA